MFGFRLNGRSRRASAMQNNDNMLAQQREREAAALRAAADKQLAEAREQAQKELAEAKAAMARLEAAKAQAARAHSGKRIGGGGLFRASKMVRVGAELVTPEKKNKQNKSLRITSMKKVGASAVKEEKPKAKPLMRIGRISKVNMA